MFKAILCAIMLACAAPAMADTADLLIEGRIGRNMQPLAAGLKKLAQTKDHINIVIDSPGGSVYAGWHFISAMKQVQAAGVTLDCYVDGMAASMAFQILSFCNGKYSLPYSTLLWHPVRASGSGGLTPEQAANLAGALKEMGDYLISELRENFTIKDEVFWSHYYQETLHLARMVVPSLPELGLKDQAPTITKDTVVARDTGFFFKRGLDYAHPYAVELWLRSR